MKRISAFVILGLLAWFVGSVAGATRAEALGSLADVSIVDRETGSVLIPHYYRGEYWVAGIPGARYAIEVRNHTGERLLAVTSVDGVNILSGATAGWDQGGYVFGGGETYRLTGWRKSDAEVAAFAFTPSPNSYAARTGRAANVGVIGVALFRERVPVAAVVPPAPPVASPSDSALARREQSYKYEQDSRAAAGAASEAPKAFDSARAQANGAPADAALAPQMPLQRESERALAFNKLGTAHGERETSYTAHTTFERQQSAPNEVITVHYDSVENLVAMGVVPPRVPPQHRPSAFPGSSYVPDPPG